MEYKQKMNEARDNAKMAFFQNPGYQHERIKNQTITIQIESSHLDKTSNVFRLIEPLVVDRLSDVYLDSFISNDFADTGAPEDPNHLTHSEVFILGITEFNIQSVSNKGVGEKYHNKIVIPNTVGSGADRKTIAHRATKFNFIGTLNPTTLPSLEISLTNSVGGAISGKGSANVWITFIIVARD